MPIVYLPMTEPVIGSMPEVEINAGSTGINDLCFITSCTARGYNPLGGQRTVAGSRKWLVLARLQFPHKNRGCRSWMAELKGVGYARVYCNKTHGKRHRPSGRYEIDSNQIPVGL